MKIGIMGGTFDPIHIGHLISAEYAREFIGLDKVIFMPSGLHPFKENSSVTSSNIRVEMTALAIAENPYYDISLIGVNREDTNYTIDDMTQLKEDYPDDELYFIIGSDIIDEIEEWKDFYQLARMCTFVLFDRWGKDQERIDEKIKQLELLYKLEVEKVKSPVVEIASTAIRNRSREGLSIRYMVSKPVEDYIMKYGIYLDNDEFKVNTEAYDENIDE